MAQAIATNTTLCKLKTIYREPRTFIGSITSLIDILIDHFLHTGVAARQNARVLTIERDAFRNAIRFHWACISSVPTNRIGY